jgi:AcrR family transcriptional regulator
MTDDESGIARRRQAASAESSALFRQRRQQIVAAAAQVFADVGYERANFNDIGQRAGVNRASLYYYFADKEELLQEVIRETVAANLERIEKIRASANTPDEKLRLAVVDMMDSYARNYPHQYVYVRADNRRLRREGDAKTQEILQLNRRYVDAIVAIVDEGMEAGVFRTVAPAPIVARSIIGMVNWTQRWYEPDGPTSGAELGAVFADLALRGILTGVSERPA